MQEQAASRPARKVKFWRQDHILLLQLKGDGLSWDETSDSFPERSKGALQYITVPNLALVRKNPRIQRSAGGPGEGDQMHTGENGGCHQKET
jgi:hypothetical protein